MFRPLILGLLLCGVAHAQAPRLPPGMPQLPPGMTLQGLQGMNFGGAPQAGGKYLVADTASARFPDAAVPGPTFTAGAPVVVLIEQGDRSRVMKGDQLGWVPTASLTDTAPAISLPPALDMPTLDLTP